MLQVTLLAEHVMDAGHDFVPLVVVSIPAENIQNPPDVQASFWPRIPSFMAHHTDGDVLPA